MRRSLYLLFLPVLLITVPALAHHSASMYALSKTITLQGTVKSFDWENPHAVLWVYTGPEPQLWSLELSSVGNIRRLGWARGSLHPGDKVVVELNPLRDGGHGGWLQKVTTASGVVLKNSVVNRRPGG